MPTGYTADVADGTITDLPTFAMKLARGMGALIMMRDEPSNAPIPDEFKPSTYNADKLAEAQAERERITAMSDEECQAAADAAVADYDKERAEAEANHAVRRQRYISMLDKVTAWEGAPEGIKDFAISQLGESMHFDCREPFRFYQDRPSNDGKQWRKAALEKALKDIAYHAKAQSEENERTENRNAWLRQLRKSLQDAPDA